MFSSLSFRLLLSMVGLVLIAFLATRIDCDLDEADYVVSLKEQLQTILKNKETLDRNKAHLKQQLAALDGIENLYNIASQGNDLFEKIV